MLICGLDSIPLEFLEDFVLPEDMSLVLLLIDFAKLIF